MFYKISNSLISIKPYCCLKGVRAAPFVPGKREQMAELVEKVVF
jgi:hypothetical protein